MQCMVNKIIGVGKHRPCGPIQTPTHGDAKSFVVLIDDYYQLIKMFQFDNGGGFTSKEFNAFFGLHGIFPKKSNYYSPKKNGILEPKKKTLMESVISMLYSNCQNPFGEKQLLQHVIFKIDFIPLS